jgi:hypothetical protein
MRSVGEGFSSNFGGSEGGDVFARRYLCDRNRLQWGRYGYAYGKFCKSGYFGGVANIA